MTDKLAAAENALAQSQAERIKELEVEGGHLREQVYLLQQSNDGIKLANDDVHKLWEQTKLALAAACEMLALMVELSGGITGADDDDKICTIKVMFSNRPTMWLADAFRKACDEIEPQLATWKAMVGES